MASKISNHDFIERLVIKSVLEDKEYAALVVPKFIPEYFENPPATDTFFHLKEYFLENNAVPDIGILKGLVNDTASVDYITSVDNLEINVKNSFDYIVDQTDAFLKKAAMKYAILRSADVVNNDWEYAEIDKRIKDALAATLKFDIGLNYWETLGTRLQRMFTDVTRLIPSYYPTLDELISGGFPPKSLSICAAAAGFGKSQWLANTASRMALHGHNVCLFTLEMSEDMYAQRFDALHTGLDINKIYTDKKKELATELSDLKKSSEGKRGTLMIKEFPTKSANAITLKSYLVEQMYRGIKFDAIFIDYLGLMVPMKEKSSDKSYDSVKRISEEVRGMSFEFDCPIISASQFNRGGVKNGFSNMSKEDVADSYGLSMTMDFGFALGFDEDAAVYKNELAAKAIKNRFGGRVGEDFLFYSDPRSLKIYDYTELDKWMDDAMKSGAKKREEFEKKN